MVGYRRPIRLRAFRVARRDADELAYAEERPLFF